MTTIEYNLQNEKKRESEENQMLILIKNIGWNSWMSCMQPSTIKVHISTL